MDHIIFAILYKYRRELFICMQLLSHATSELTSELSNYSQEPYQCSVKLVHYFDALNKPDQAWSFVRKPSWNSCHPFKKLHPSASKVHTSSSRTEHVYLWCWRPISTWWPRNPKVTLYCLYWPSQGSIITIALDFEVLVTSQTNCELEICGPKSGNCLD